MEFLKSRVYCTRLQSIQFCNMHPKNDVKAPWFLAPKFKIIVLESELCTVNLKNSPLFLTFVSFEKKGTKNWMLQSATLPPSPHPNPTYPSPLITIIRNQILGPPNLVTWLINNFQEKNNGQFPYLLFKYLINDQDGIALIFM